MLGQHMQEGIHFNDTFTGPLCDLCQTHLGDYRFVKEIPNSDGRQDGIP